MYASLYMTTSNKIGGFLIDDEVCSLKKEVQEIKDIMSRQGGNSRNALPFQIERSNVQVFIFIV